MEVEGIERWGIEHKETETQSERPHSRSIGLSLAGSHYRVTTGLIGQFIIIIIIILSN